MTTETTIRLGDSSLEFYGKRTIGQILLGFGYITKDELEQAIKLQRNRISEGSVSAATGNTTMRLGEILIENGYITKEKIEEALSKQSQMVIGRRKNKIYPLTHSIRSIIYGLAAITLAVTILFVSVRGINLIFKPQWVKYALNFLAYFSLFLLFYNSSTYSSWKGESEKRVRTIFLVVLIYSFLIELVQLFTPYRAFSYLDIIFAFFGVFSAALIVTHNKWGLVEINYPPSEEMEEEVRLRHTSNGKSLEEVPFKRGFDIGASFFGLIFSLPIWLFVILIIWLEDPGPIFFVKTCLGKGGRSFRQIKFRTMIKGAETKTGPILALNTDPRFLIIGSILRKTALDELPQLLNILKGDMSFVGPRPQRTILVHRYLNEIPSYTLRHMVRPGLTGIAQVYGHYYVSPRQKLRFDLIYLRKRGFWFDLKLFVYSFFISSVGGWQNNRGSDRKRILS